MSSSQSADTDRLEVEPAQVGEEQQGRFRPIAGQLAGFLLERAEHTGVLGSVVGEVDVALPSQLGELVDVLLGPARQVLGDVMDLVLHDVPIGHAEQGARHAMFGAVQHSQHEGKFHAAPPTVSAAVPPVVRAMLASTGLDAVLVGAGRPCRRRWRRD